MTVEQKQRIRVLRGRGLDYGEIAATLGLIKGTVKTYCWRNGLEKGVTPEAVIAVEEHRTTCRHCEKSITGMSRTKPRKFCSDACRYTWWRQHRDQMKSKTVRPLTCAHCGRVFIGGRGRKYCSHPCYITSRFGEVAS